MSARRGKILVCALIAVATLMAGSVVVWRYLRGGPVEDRLDLVGPETEAFVTFLAAPEDKPLVELIEALRSREPGPGGEKRSEWLRAVSDPLSGVLLQRARAFALVENGGDGQCQLGFVVSLGRMANVVVRMLFGIANTEREVETYRDERITIGRSGQEYSVALVGHRLIASRDPRTVKRIIDRIKKLSVSGKASERLEAVLKDVDPGREMPGYGALVNDQSSLASIWRMATGAPEGSTIALPGSFQGAGFRFGLVSANILRGEGLFYFSDEQAAAGAQRQIEAAIMRAFAHFKLEPRVTIEQEGSRLRVGVDVRGVQTALDHYLVSLPGRKQ